MNYAVYHVNHHTIFIIRSRESVAVLQDAHNCLDVFTPKQGGFERAKHYALEQLEKRMARLRCEHTRITQMTEKDCV